MSAFNIKRHWLPINAGTLDELMATHARMQIFVNNRNITEHKAPRSKPEPAIEIPIYYLAEWIAENWWVLLFEPRKDEEKDDPEYLTRHSILAAQGGFPLPALSIVPTGRAIHLNCVPRDAPFANVRFTADAFADVERSEMEKTLTTFIRETVERLKSYHVKDTALERAWNSLESLALEERQFCELVGSLGLYPGEVTDALSAAIERIHDALGTRAMRDFCLAATGSNVESSVGHASLLDGRLKKEPDVALTELLKVDLPPENYNAPSWRRGYLAAKNVREHFGFDTKSKIGADIVFERLKVDPESEPAIKPNESTPLPFAGAVERQQGRANIELLQADLLRRRFTAIRAAYLAWASEAQSRRLLTNAVTRDQQASRAFAAEILIPQTYLKFAAGSKRALHHEQLREIARERKVMSDVAFKQAYNAGIQIRH